MMQADAQLLRDYAEAKSQDAFTEVVRRHLDLVYSAALRQVRSPQLAEEISQSVFTDLARSADKLKPDTVLTAWLYQVTRRTAIDVIRRESRRQARERLAVEMAAMNTSADWSHIEPLLDDAMETLDEPDRAAILLRYFENKSLREVGQSLGTSDDAAQKRVGRAVERLREFFSKRGIAVGASGLIILISANAVQSAPLALAGTISSTVILTGTTIHTSIAITATKAIAMTLFQKALVTTTVAVIAGAGIYEAHRATQLRQQVETLQQQQAPLVAQVQQLQQERNEATNQIASLTDELDKIKNGNLELLKLRGQVTVLQNELTKQMANKSAPDNNLTNTDDDPPYKRHAKLLMAYFDANPSAQIPEMKLLPKDFLASIYGLAVKLAAQDNPAKYGKQGFFDENRIGLETNEEYRRAASELRSYAEYSLAPTLVTALKDYLQANNGAYPKSVSEIQPFLSSPIDPTILQRYDIQPASNYSKIQSKYISTARMDGFVITPRTAVDEDFDHRIIIGPTNYMVGEPGSFKP
ncbi:MAG TPA: sigma-70 family RNA polymerase sigma factor [Verrucomicrobiae bacterium]|nr:sigma-70 family RNA polymerase sigma factor [Verrucomicrobiae bacterium]